MNEPTLRLVRVDGVPEGYADLVAEAEGGAAMSATTPAGETVVLAAFADGALAGIGALAQDEDPPRVFKLFVRPDFRRRGVGRALAGALAHEALDGAPAVCIDAADADAARFWEAIGFRPSPGERRTHILRRNGS